MKPHTVSRPAGASPAARPQRAFEEIHINTLRLNTVLPFLLYTRIEGEYIVYRRENLPFTYTQRQALLDNQIETLHIASGQRPAYWEYLRGNIHTILDDPSVPLDERADVVYGASEELTRQVFELPLTTDDMDIARTVVSHNIKFLDEGKPSLHAVMSQMETRPKLYSHALNVCQYGVALAHECGMTDPREREAFGLGLLCQDLGMLKISDHLVFKAGPLSFEEWSMIKRHPTLGLEAVERVPDFPDLARDIIFGHHERLDGSGYPRGLTGDEIPLPLRIAGVADVFASLTCSRPFRDAASSFDALRVMKSDMAGSFDPRLLDVFVRLLGV